MYSFREWSFTRTNNGESVSKEPERRDNNNSRTTEMRWASPVMNRCERPLCTPSNEAVQQRHRTRINEANSKDRLSKQPKNIKTLEGRNDKHVHWEDSRKEMSGFEEQGSRKPHHRHEKKTCSTSSRTKSNVKRNPQLRIKAITSKHATWDSEDVLGAAECTIKERSRETAKNFAKSLRLLDREHELEDCKDKAKPNDISSVIAEVSHYSPRRNNIMEAGFLRIGSRFSSNHSSPLPPYNCGNWDSDRAYYDPEFANRKGYKNSGKSFGNPKIPWELKHIDDRGQVKFRTWQPGTLDNKPLHDRLLVDLEE